MKSLLYFDHNRKSPPIQKPDDIAKLLIGHHKDRLCGIYAEKYERLQEVERLIEEKDDKRAILTGVAKQLQAVKGGITEFDAELWGGLVERVDVDKHAATVVFRGGIAIGV